MRIVVLLVVLVVLVAIPLSALGRVVHLFRTRYDKCANDSAGEGTWSSRLYSASKRATLAWAAEIVFCIVVYLGIGWYDSQWLPEKYHFWILCAIPIVTFAWGWSSPRVYKDGVERVQNRRGLAWLALAILLFPIFAVTFGVSRPIAPFLHRERGRKELTIRADKWSAWEFRMADVAPEMIPWAATDIELVFRPCAALGLGGHATLRCKVERDGLAAFAKARGYEFQSESIERNACTDGCGDCNFIWQVWRKYNGNASYPADFLAYNYRYATCGGYSFLYDVAAATLYAEWSSN